MWCLGAVNDLIVNLLFDECNKNPAPRGWYVEIVM
jgi:hypothetical protein